MVEKQAAKTSTIIESQLYATIPMMPIDADRLKEVMLNLLINAIQAMPKGGTILVKTGKKEYLSTWDGVALLHF